MKVLNFTLIFMLVSGLAFAQKYSAKQIVPVEEIAELKVRPTDAKEAVFLDNKWYAGNIRLGSGVEISDCPMRLDIHNQLVELNLSGKLMVVEDRKVDYFEWKNTDLNELEKFENANNFNVDASRLDGYFQVFNEGNYKFLVRNRIVQDEYSDPQRPQFAPRIVLNRVSDYFVDNGEETILVEKNKKEFFKVFDGLASDVAAYMKKNKMKIRNPREVGKVFDYYNSLASK